MNCDWLFPTSSGEGLAWMFEGFDRLVEAIDGRGLDAMPLVMGAPRYASAGRLDGGYGDYAFAPFVDPKIFGDCIRFANRYPQIGMIQIFEEPNNGEAGYLAHWAQVPSLVVSETKQASLGAWYENPEIRIIAGGLVHHTPIFRGDQELVRILVRMLQLIRKLRRRLRVAYRSCPTCFGSSPFNMIPSPTLLCTWVALSMS